MSTTNNNVLIKQLIEFGLSDKEANVYLALLELEVAAVSDIAKAASINRSSAYVVLDSLGKKGLVSISEDKKVKRYIPTNPEMFLYEAENKAKIAQKIKDQINNIVPELKALHKDTKHRPKVKVYEGKEGLIHAFEDTLSSKEKIMRVFSSTENIFKVLPDYFPNYVQRRIELGIRMYGIHPDDKAARYMMKMDPTFDKPKLIPRERYKLGADIAIWDNKIGHMSPTENISILIESKEIADVMKNIFDLAYEEAKRLNKDINKKR